MLFCYKYLKFLHEWYSSFILSITTNRYSFLVKIKIEEAFCTFFFYFNIVISYNLYYTMFDLHTDHFFPILWKILVKIANHLKWINTWKCFQCRLFWSLHNPLVWTPFQKLLGDHFGVSVEKNGDHFGIDLGVISGLGISHFVVGIISGVVQGSDRHLKGPLER